MPGSGGGLNQRMVRGLEPGRGVGTVLHAAITLVLGGVLTFDRFPAQRPSGLPAVDIPAPVLPFVGLFAALALLGALFNARRWYTLTSIVWMSKDPALRSVLPPVEAEPTGSFAPPRQRPVVEFRSAPRLFGRTPAKRRVTRTHNVVGRAPLQIVYLRVFDNRPRARTFARGAWREFGYVHLLRSAASVGPGEFARYRRERRLGELFVSSTPRLRDELDRAPVEPERPGWRLLPTIAGSSVLTYDRYGAYPVRSPLCHADFWTTALDELLHRADLVVLDLSGFHRRFRGTQLELQRIVDAVPVEKVVLLADPFSNRRFLREQVELAWDRMAADSPNRAAEANTVRGYVTDWYLDQVDDRGRTIRRTLRASRRQTRWLLARTQERLADQVTDGPDEASPVEDSGDRSGQGRRWGLLGWGAVVAAVVAAVAVLVLYPVGGVVGGVVGGGTAATVVPGSGYHLRSGPSAGSPRVGSALPAGRHVVVDCMHGNWARLQDPAPGAFVYGEGLRMDGDPPDCPRS